MVGAITVFVILLALLCRMFSINLTQEHVTVRQGTRRVSIGWEQLTEVSVTEPAGRWPQWMRNWNLTLVGSDGKKTRVALTGVPPADRRRLLEAIEEQAPPAVIRRDTAIRDMLGEPER